MPIVSPSTYKPKFPFRNPHVNTMYHPFFRKGINTHFERERLTTPDDDFIDIDWARLTTQSDKLLILLHGLEGNARRPYMKGAIKAGHQLGMDCCAINFRSCSGEMNVGTRFYHSGETSDLGFIVDQMNARQLYKEIYFIGFSLGGNVLLKYLGEQGNYASAKKIKGAFAVSVPVDLASCSTQMLARENKFYSNKFLKDLKLKVKARNDLFDVELTARVLKSTSMIEFDNLITAPLHGFKDAQDYYQKSASINFLNELAIPTYLLNAADDTFLANENYPHQLAQSHPFLFFEESQYGGHVGFVTFNKENLYYYELKMIEFFGSLSSSS